MANLDRSRPGALIGVAFSGVFLGAALGAITNSINGWVSPLYGVPDDFGQMLRYAWVGGSIWGVQFGGLASVIVGSVLFRAKWRHLPEDPHNPK